MNKKLEKVDELKKNFYAQLGKVRERVKGLYKEEKLRAFTKNLYAKVGKAKELMKNLYTKCREVRWKEYILKAKEFILKEKLKFTLSLTGIVIITLLSITIYQAGLGYKVVFNGQVLGMVKKQEDFQQILYSINEEVKSSQGEKATFQQDYSLEKVRIKGEQLTSDQELKSKILNTIQLEAPAAVIKVEGEEVVAVESLQEAEEILEELKQPYEEKKENVEIKEVDFSEKVEVVESMVSLEKILPKEEAFQYLQQGTDELEIYEVATGDTAWDISRSFDLGIREIEQANPDIDVENLHPGDKINLTVPKPFINVRSVQEVVYTEQISYETTYKDDSSIYRGQQRVITQGKYGTKEVKAEIVYENGIEKSRNILQEKVLKEPTTQVVAKGTKALPPAQGTGSFRRPASGSTGSRGVFGASRDEGTRRHAGVDISNKTGTPIYAADGGTVTSYTGYRSGYGYIVEINHGAGYTTRYAHLDKILVEAGQRVAKGQLIGKMGSTGGNWGPHLHFEIRKNGTPLNPFNYIR